jgi:hypothetical protein
MFEIQDALRGLNIKELREQCRARGLNPAGQEKSHVPDLQESQHAFLVLDSLDIAQFPA